MNMSFMLASRPEPSSHLTASQSAKNESNNCTRGPSGEVARKPRRSMPGTAAMSSQRQKRANVAENAKRQVKGISFFIIDSFCMSF
jgi:hypothetical protein